MFACIFCLNAGWESMLKTREHGIGEADEGRAWRQELAKILFGLWQLNSIAGLTVERVFNILQSFTRDYDLW